MALCCGIFAKTEKILTLKMEIMVYAVLVVALILFIERASKRVPLKKHSPKREN
jgi:hypothetical protein